MDSNEWYELLCRQLEMAGMTRSDAQGLIEVDNLAVKAAYQEGATPEATAEMILNPDNWLGVGQ